MAQQSLDLQDYEIIRGSTIERDYNEIMLTRRLQDANERINGGRR